MGDNGWYFDVTATDGTVELVVVDAMDDNALHEALSAAAALFPGWYIEDSGEFGESGEFYRLGPPGVDL